jgi:hypothetical protein
LRKIYEGGAVELSELANKVFNYSVLDISTQEELKKKEFNIRRLESNVFTEIGRELSEAQNLLKGSNQYDGQFLKWLDFMGYSQRTAYELINRYNELLRIPQEQVSTFESLPLSLSKHVSAKSSSSTKAKAQAKSEVLSGEIATLKAYKERIKELEDANKQTETRARIAEKDSEILRGTLESLEDKDPEIQYVEVEKEPEDYQRIKDELRRLKAKADETEDPGDYRSYGMKLAKEMYKAFDEMSQWQKNYAWLITDKSEFKRLADSDKDFEREFRRLDEFWRQLSDAFNGLNRKDVSDNIIDVVVDSIKGGN